MVFLFQLSGFQGPWDRLPAKNPRTPDLSPAPRGAAVQCWRNIERVLKELEKVLKTCSRCPSIDSFVREVVWCMGTGNRKRQAGAAQDYHVPGTPVTSETEQQNIRIIRDWLHVLASLRALEDLLVFWMFQCWAVPRLFIHIHWLVVHPHSWSFRPSWVFLPMSTPKCTNSSTALLQQTLERHCQDLLVFVCQSKCLSNECCELLQCNDIPIIFQYCSQATHLVWCGCILCLRHALKSHCSFHVLFVSEGPKSSKHHLTNSKVSE